MQHNSLKLQEPIDFEQIIQSIKKPRKEKPQRAGFRCINCYSVQKLNDDNLCPDCEKSRLFEKAGIPQRYRDATLRSCIRTAENSALLLFCNQYAATKIKTSGIFLHGACGTGKTHIAIATVYDMVMRSAVLFTTTTNLLLSVRRTFDNSGLQGTEADLLRRFSTSSMLVLDDLGIEKQSEWSKQILGQIIQERDANQKPTIITSNLHLSEIASKIAPRIASRIVGSCTIWKLGGMDFRVAQMQKLQ
jgi:DNA replication protein DnaC